MRSTRPVAKNSSVIGIIRKVDAENKAAAIQPKNTKGFVSFSSIAIMERMRSPSRKVDSLLAEPSTRRP